VQGVLGKFSLDFPPKRPIAWRVLPGLVILYFLGNLAGVPLLLRVNQPIEPVWFWGVATILASCLIAISLAMASRTALGAPLLEGKLSRDDFLKWMRRGSILTSLMLLAAGPVGLYLNRSLDPGTYPLGWELLGASFKAGVVEELGNRFFLVTLFAWAGGFLKRDQDGRPARGVYWGAILLSGLLFGWAHVDAQLGNPSITFTDYGFLMALNSSLGVFFGWLYWKLGLEWAMFAHFAYDAVISMVLIPIFLL
jgi:hypothetical protein